MPYKGDSNVAVGTTGNVILTVHANTVAGDTMLAIMMTVDNNPPVVFTAPTNETWTVEQANIVMGTQAASPPACYYYSKVASADDEANAGTKTYQWTLGSGEEKLGWMGLYDPATVPGQWANNAQTGTGTIATAPSITTTVSDEIVFHCVYRDSATAFTGLPSGNLRLNLIAGSGASGGTLAIVEDTYATPNTVTGTKNFTLTTDERSGFTFSIEPAPSGGDFTQGAFRGRNDDGNITAATWIANANVAWSQLPDENFRVRFLIQEEDDVEDLNTEFKLQYQVNAGSWTDVSGSSGNVRSNASPNVTDGVDTTQILGSGNLITTNAGFDEVDGLAGNANIDWTTTANQEVELEYCIHLRSAELVKGDVANLRVAKWANAASTPLTTYTNVPTVTPLFEAFRQQYFRGRNDNGNIESATWKAASNVNWIQTLDTNFRVRFLIQEYNDWPVNDATFQLQYNLDGGGWLDVNASSSVVRANASPNVGDGDDTTQILGVGTFITPNGGFDEVNGLAGNASLDFAGLDEVEVEYCAQLRSADISEGELVELRIVVGGGALLDTYIANPSITPKFPTHWVMALSSNIADEETTTRQLTDIPSKIFQAGVCLEDDNEATTTVINESSFTEYEFCVQAATSANSAVAYEFKVVEERQIGEVLDSYNKTPKATLT